MPPRLSKRVAAGLRLIARGGEVDRVVDRSRCRVVTHDHVPRIGAGRGVGASGSQGGRSAVAERAAIELPSHKRCGRRTELSSQGVVRAGQVRFIDLDANRGRDGPVGRATGQRETGGCRTEFADVAQGRRGCGRAGSRRRSAGGFDRQADRTVDRACDGERSRRRGGGGGQGGSGSCDQEADGERGVVEFHIS